MFAEVCSRKKKKKKKHHTGFFCIIEAAEVYHFD